MAVKLTKNELKVPKDRLKQFQRYLPTLQLKKQQLQSVVMQVNAQLEQVERERRAAVDGLDDVSAVFTMAPNYDITIVLHLADGGDSDCRLVLTLRENKADPTVSTVSGGGLWVRDVTTTTTTISWPSDNATIEKEAVVSKS